MKIGFLVVLIASFISAIVAECPNACSAHGKCGAYDMCTCFRNWMANDCSERICQFGLAHVDTPKGDLDSSGGKLTGPDSTVVMNDQVYPFGTTEQYPATTDTNGNIVTQSAHEYRECSNKGICDRTSGTCACFEGYEGSACQRASCPTNANGVCSGHGTCQTISEIAANDHDNIYRLWDEQSTMGCVCDGGYTGSDCSQRQCKVGVDPLYFDNNATTRYANFTYHLYTRDSKAEITGNYSIVFYDSYGEDWQTDPIPWNADCDTLTTTLEALPNNVIPAGSVRCLKYDVTTGTTSGQIRGRHPIYDAKMYVITEYTIAFPQNPGKLKQIQINKYLDGSRPTLYTDEMSGNTLGWHIFPNGYIGEDVDMVPDRCFDVTVTIQDDTYSSYLSGIDPIEAKLLKTCLGDSDGDSSNNVEVYNWDYGDAYNPHLIKLQDATQYNPALRVDASTGLYNYDTTLVDVPLTALCSSSGDEAKFGVGHDSSSLGLCENKNPPGFFAVLYYDASSLNPFRLYTRAGNDYATTTEFFVYTTTGYLNLVNPYSVVFTARDDYSSAQKIASYYSNVLGIAQNPEGEKTYTGYDGDMACESNAAGVNGARDCFEKDDYAIFLNTKNTTAALAANPYYVNMYQVKKIYKADVLNGTDTVPYYYNDISRLKMVLDYAMNAEFLYSNATVKDRTAHAYKFYPPPASPTGGYKYALPCAGRGICDGETGLCDCFNGYDDDDCTCINANAV